MSEFFMLGVHAALIALGFVAVVAAILAGLWLLTLAGVIIHERFTR